MTGSRRAWLVVPGVACAVLLLLVVVPRFRGTAQTPPAAALTTVAASSAPVEPVDRQTIEYRGVHVDIPSAWQRVDSSGCEVRYEMWAAPGSPPCRLTRGVVFYGAATFDPAHGPGVRQDDGTTWAGYVYAGSYAVYASDTDRDLVREVLDSARPPR